MSDTSHEVARIRVARAATVITVSETQMSRTSLHDHLARITGGPSATPTPTPQAGPASPTGQSSAAPAIDDGAEPRVVYVDPAIESALVTTLATLVEHDASYELLPRAGDRELSGVRALVTRSLEQATPLAKVLFEHGAHVLVAPCLAVAAGRTPECLREAIDTLHRYEGLILSSPIAARVFFSELVAAGTSATAFAGRLAVIGPSTAAFCREQGKPPDIVAQSPRSEGLAIELERHGALGSRWLHLRADEGRDTLALAFAKAGGSLTIVEAYRTIMPRWSAGLLETALETHNQREVAFLTSGKAGRHLLHTLRAYDPVATADYFERAQIVSIGPTTTHALRGLGLSTAATANAPTDQAMAQAALELNATS